MNDRKKADGKRVSDDPQWGTIDASPERQGQEFNQALKSVQDTKVWKDSTTGLKKMWSNYLQMLAESFGRMGRAQQEDLIKRVCVIVTIGVSIILLTLFYSFLPVIVRSLVVPIVLALAYFAGSRVVTPVMIVRYEKYLNREF